MSGVTQAVAAFAPAARRYPIEYTANGVVYGPWTIYFDPPPIPTRECDWHYVHKDFDGAPDANDNRCGSAASFAACLNECDEMEDDALLSARSEGGEK